MGWVPMLAGDANPEVAELLVDGRARHFWDGETRLARYVGKQLGYGDDARAWDVFLVYGPNATWGDGPAAVGSPVISAAGQLERALAPHLGRAAPS